MKYLSLIIMMMTLIACEYETKEEYEDCFGNLSSSSVGYPTYAQGVLSAVQKFRTTYEIKTNWRTWETKRSVYDRRGLSACQLICETGYTKYNVSLNSLYSSIYQGHPTPDSVCVPNPPACKKVQMNYSTFGFTNAADNYTYVDDPECAPTTCSEGFSLNDSGESPECVSTVVGCSLEELSPNASGATKTFDEETDTYGACVTDGCNEGFEKVGNECIATNPDPVLGCTAPGASNYNSEANTNDGSCTCEEGFTFDSEQGVCLPSELVCDPMQIYNPITMICEDIN